jgi:hypothetical protein
MFKRKWNWLWGKNQGEFTVRHKPGSVIGGRVSAHQRRLSIWDVCYQTPLAVPLSNGTGKRPTLVPPTLLPTGVYRANASRRCWCALTAPLHPYPKAVSFCGTILTIARTGRYPASLVFWEPGLSSDSIESVITYAHYEPPYPILLQNQLSVISYH